MPTNTKKKNTSNNNPTAVQTQVILRQYGGDGTGDVTQAELSSAITTHNFAPSSHKPLDDKINLRNVLDIEIDATRTKLTITYADNHQEVIDLAI